MVKIHFLDDKDQVTKQFGSRPMRTGLQKDLARYRLEAIALGMKRIDMPGTADEGGPSLLEQAQEFVDLATALADRKHALILRAFGDQFSLDDLYKYTTAEEVDRVLAGLIAEASGIIQKN